MTEELIYSERLSSNKTEALFVALALLFFTLFTWRAYVRGIDLLAMVLFGIFSLFFFYSLNYRTLIINLTPEALELKFGIFTWNVPWDNIEECSLDHIPVIKRLGGAGIHFMSVRKRYRASFNFLEYPRVVVAFKRKRGPVQDISFSTRRPDEVIRLIGEAVSENSAAQHG